MASGWYATRDGGEPAAATTPTEEPPTATVRTPTDGVSALVDRYAPDLYFGRLEKWFPTDPRAFIEEADEPRPVEGFTALEEYSETYARTGTPPEPTVFYRVTEAADGVDAVQYWMSSAFDQFTTNFHWHDWELLQVFVDRESGDPLLVSASAHSRGVPNNEVLEPDLGDGRRPGVLSEVGSHSSASEVNGVVPSFERLGSGGVALDVTNDFLEYVSDVRVPFAYGLPRDEGARLPFVVPELDGARLDRHPELSVDRSDFVDESVTVGSWNGLPTPPSELPLREPGLVFAHPDSPVDADVTYGLEPIEDLPAEISDFEGPQLSFEFFVPGFVEDRIASHVTSVGIPWEQTRYDDPLADVTDPTHRRRIDGATPSGLRNRVVGRVRQLRAGAGGVLDRVTDDARAALENLGYVTVSLASPPTELAVQLASEDPAATVTRDGTFGFLHVEEGDHRLVVNGPGFAPLAERFVHDGGRYRAGSNGDLAVVANEDAAWIRGDGSEATGVDSVRVVEDYAGVVFDGRPAESDRFAVAVHPEGQYTVEVTDAAGRRGSYRVAPGDFDGGDEVVFDPVETGKRVLVVALREYLVDLRDLAARLRERDSRDGEDGDGPPDGGSSDREETDEPIRRESVVLRELSSAIEAADGALQEIEGDRPGAANDRLSNVVASLEAALDVLYATGRDGFEDASVAALAPRLRTGIPRTDDAIATEIACSPGGRRVVTYWARRREPSSMATFDAGDVTLHKVRDYVWEIPQDQEAGMRVPARVLASEALLEEISDDKTLEQLKNTTHLPGIRKYALCMPDGHQGYGFPVGGVAGIDAEDGCISPGAVGYDINCLTGDSDVRLSFGRRMPIADLRERFEDEDVIVAADELTDSGVQLFTESDEKQVFEVEMATGRTLRATGDHPLSTPEGMVELENLDEGDTVFVHPFEGIEHEKPDEFTVLTESDFANENPQLVAFLKRNDLLPLQSTDDAFNRLLKLAGFHTGDGTFRGKQTWFYADPEDLQAIREDISALGITPSRIYSRERDHEIDGNEFTRTEYSVKVGAHGLKQLLLRLGVPDGRKVESDFVLPDWFDRLTNWQRALYLSAFFGAEMNAPSPMSNTCLYCPKVSQNRRTTVADAGEEFMRGIAGALEELGIETNTIERFAAETEGTERLRLGVKNDSENLLRFFSKVGYRYNRDKRQKAALAIHYLRIKERIIERRENIAAEVETLADGGTPVSELKEQYEINDRFVERSAWSGRLGRPRPPNDFPTFEEFCESTDVLENLTLPVEIDTIEPAGTEPVYDIGVEHEAHNFVADGFVVSNCGVRMVKTDLSYADVQGTEEELVDALFDAVPSGLGGGGVVQGDQATVEGVLERGVDWALEEGYAVQSDLDHCEDEGRRPDADPSTVSKKAKDRGRNQLGSLGSGNHFLEVQRVTDVFDEEVADAYGLRADQIVVLIHCGSRGLGHQVCNDYLRKIEQAHSGLLSQLPDKELAAAPAGSQLAEDYYGAMCAAINFAWVNRQLITHQTREVFADVFGEPREDLGMELLYDVAHNIAKKEVHEVDGEQTELYVHRKGATRAFPAGRPEVPSAYRDVGQPVIIPGSMGAGSYVLRGGEASMAETFGSTAHGAGRLMSRTQAKDEFWGGDVQDDLRDQQVYVKANSGATIAEEAPGVYKDVDEVVRVSDALGIGDKVVRVAPVCNIKG